MKTVIVYKTIYGSSKQYAQWLGKDFKFKVFEMDGFKDFSKYDHLIVISGTYAGRMPLVKFLKKNWDKVKDKKLTIVALGTLKPSHWWSKVTYFLMPRKIKRQAKYFKIYGKPPEGSEPIKKIYLKPVKNYLK